MIIRVGGDTNQCVQSKNRETDVNQGSVDMRSSRFYAHRKVDAQSLSRNFKFRRGVSVRLNEKPSKTAVARGHFSDTTNQESKSHTQIDNSLQRKFLQSSDIDSLTVIAQPVSVCRS